MKTKLLVMTTLSLAMTVPALHAGIAQTAASDPTAALQPLDDSPRVPFQGKTTRPGRTAASRDLSGFNAGRDMGPPPGLGVPGPTTGGNDMALAPFTAAAGEMAAPPAGGAGVSIPFSPALTMPAVPAPPPPPPPPPPPRPASAW